jgi:formylglycine-generating enzyme required for sulfatase activity
MPAAWWRQPVAIAAILAIVAVLGVTTYILGRGPRGAVGDGSSLEGPGGSSKPGEPAPRGTSTPAPAADKDTVASGGPAAPDTATSPGPGRGGAPRPRTRINKADGQTYVWIPPGEFVMGCSPGDPACDPDELPPHPVRVQGFWLAQTELTGAQYRRAMAGGDARLTAPDEPVAGMNWNAAKAYCARVGGRLPAEPEWEYAARGGTTTRAYGRLDAIGWHRGNSSDEVHPVAQLKPNAFNLYDMLGNVHEWVLDRYFNRYDDSGGETIVEPTAPNALATVRGGAWTTVPGNLRVSMRLARDPESGDANIGVRCAQDEDRK